MGFGGEAQHAGDRDVGMSDAGPEPVWRGDRGALGFQYIEHAADLGLATLDPEFQLILAQHALVDQADRLVAEPGCQRADFQGMAALRPVLRDHCLRRPDHLIEIIQDRGTFDQDFTVLEHQRRHPPQRIERRDLVGVAKGRPRPVLKGEAVKLERNRHAPGERGIILADQDHGVRGTLIGLDGYDLRLPEIGRSRAGMTTGKYYPSPSSLASSPFTARAQPLSLRSRVAWLIAGLKRCSRRQLSANLAGSG